MGIPAPTELLLILAIVVLVFGTKRIPEIMGGIGEGIKTFKKSLEGEETPTAHGHGQPPQQLSHTEGGPADTNPRPHK